MFASLTGNAAKMICAVPCCVPTAAMKHALGGARGKRLLTLTEEMDMRSAGYIMGHITGSLTFSGEPRPKGANRGDRDKCKCKVLLLKIP